MIYVKTRWIYRKLAASVDDIFLVSFGLCLLHRGLNKPFLFHIGYALVVLMFILTITLIRRNLRTKDKKRKKRMIYYAFDFFWCIGFFIIYTSWLFEIPFRLSF